MRFIVKFHSGFLIWQEIAFKTSHTKTMWSHDWRLQVWCITDTSNQFMPPTICSMSSTGSTHTHPFNGPFSGTTQVSRYQKGKTNLDFTEARDSEWQWHQLGYMQVCTSLQTDNHASNPPLSFFTGRMPFLRPNQQCQSTEAVTAWQCLCMFLMKQTVF